MANARVSIKSVMALAETQIGGLKKFPALAEGLPFTAADLDLEVADYFKAGVEHAAAKGEMKVMTRALAARRFALRDKLTRNIAALQAALGKYAEELTYIGGTPLKGKHSTESSTPPGEAPTGTDSAKA